MQKGELYIISAPSGAGKTSLIKQLLTDSDLLSVSISHTTRKIRSSETDGKDYYFTSVDEFKQMITDKAFLEHAKVFDHYYGTSTLSVEDNLKKGIDTILEIDWQGAQQVRRIFPVCISIFILPPSIEILQQRLKSRAQDSKDVIDRRMRDAINEMSHFSEFDYLVVNDVFSQALAELRSIITSHRLKKSHQLKVLAPLLENLIASTRN